ncbi:collagen binding domain-containing protein [Enterococcus faecalis]
MSLGISELASGETMTLRMASEKYSYSMTPFEIGDALQVIPNDDGTWTIKALQTLTDYSADLQLKLRYNQNLSEDFEDQVVFTFGDSQKIVKINIGQYVEKVPPTELVRKVPLGFTSEGRIAWVIYFNYNQAGLSGSEKTTFKFLDNVGPNQTLAIDSIAAYLTKQPILETNGEMIRNLEHDEYSYDASQFFQKNASESGFNYEAEKFEGIPTATGSYLSNKNAYYIYLETIPNENIPSDAVLSNYTYMRISSEGFDAWEDDDIAYITADESSDGTGRGGVVLEKIDAVTAKVLEGAVFKVVNTKTQQVVQETLTTNQAGQIRLAGLEAGQYAFIETKAPTGYKLDATPVPFEIKLEQTQTIRLKKENTRLENQLKVEKVDENNEVKRLAGAEFSLYDQKNNLIEKGVTNENGELLFSNLSPDGEYYLVETKAPNGYELDETKHPVSFAGKADYTLTYRVKNKQQVQIGSIKIVKQDKESKKRLTGAEFQWKDTVTGKTGTVTVGTDGTVTIPNLAVNRTYELTETKAPTGYVLDKTVHKVTLTTAQANKVVTVIIENTAQKGSIKIVKQDKESKKRLTGAEFQWKDTVTGKTGTVTVGTDGTVTIPNLAVNRTYELTETKAPTGYVLDKTVHKVTLTTAQANKVVTVIIENTAQKGSIKIVKQDKDSKKRLTGAEFQWKDTVTGKTGIVTVGTDGTITIPNLSVNRTYEITETKAPVGYVLDKTVHKVTLTTAQANKVVTVIIENTAQKGSLAIIKVDKDSRKRLAGAEFKWRDTVTGKEGTVVADKNGQALITDLPVNRVYEITEIKASNGYILNNKTYRVILTTNFADKIGYYTIENTAQEGSLAIIKVDKDSRKRLAGAEFKWRDTVTGKEGTVVADKNGQALITNLPVNRVYEITEIKAPNGYILNNKTYRVILTTNFADKIGYYTIENTAQKGSLAIIKVDKDSRKRLAGAEFKWRDTVTGKEGTVVADKNGQALITNLPVNRVYEITEIKAPNGYILNNKTYRVTLTTNFADKIGYYTIENVALRGNLKLIKQDGYSKQRLAGAQFRWRDTVNGNTGVVTANANGEATLYNFSVNRIYEITEIKAPNGYILDRTVHKILLPANYAGKTYTFTKNNQAQKGAIKIVKQDGYTKQRLAGAQFKFRDTTNNYTATFTANRNGEVLITGLAGDRIYEVTEIKAPNGYIIDRRVHKVDLRGQGGKTYTLVLNNQAQKGAIKIVKQDGYTKQRLAGAQFKFRDTTNNYTATFTANRNGEVLITGLAGDRIYGITEIKAPNGYIIDRRVHKVDLRGQGGKTYTLVLNNQAQKGAIKIIKQDTDTRKRLAGAKFRFRDTTNNYTATFTANGNGEVLIPGLSSDRIYEITEIQAPTGYALDSRVHRIDLRGQGTKTYTLVLNNKANYGAIRIIKQDVETKARLAGAVFEWKDTTNGYTQRVTTGWDGTVTISGLSVNRVYEIREVQAPAGYSRNTTPTRVSLTQNHAGQTIAIVRENRKIPVYNPPPPTYWPGYIPPVTYYNPPVYYNPPKYYYRGCVMVIVVVCW